MRAFLIAAALLISAPAHAACKTAGSADAKVVEALPEDAGAEFNKAMAAATSPDTVNKAVKALQPACTRTGRAFGENTDAFPRIWKGVGQTAPLDIAFLQPVTFKHAGKTVTWYAIVRSFGSGAVLLSGLLDGIPTDERAEKLLRQPYDGGFEPLEFDAKAGQLVDKNVYLPGQLKRAAAADKRASP